MTPPSKEEREHARATYLRLLGDTEPLRAKATGATFVEAYSCVRVALRLADFEARLFGLSPFTGNRWPESHESACAWIDRVALEIAAWRGVPIEERKERTHVRERRNTEVR